MKTHHGCIPLHLACHCGCDVGVASELLNAMEDDSNLQKGEEGVTPEMVEKDDPLLTPEMVEKDDPLLPRDVRGRTPLHLACASSRDPRRRPDLIRLLLLRSKDPGRAALARDCVDLDQRVGVDLALGDLQVIIGGLDVEDDGNEKTDSRRSSMGSNGDAFTSKSGQQQQHLVGRTPLNLIVDDYHEELEEALLPGFAIADVIAACQGETNEGGDKDGGVVASLIAPDSNIDVMYECWAILSLLLLAAGTPGTIDRVREALGGTVDNSSSTGDIFSKSCHDVVKDFQAIYQACQSLDNCPAQFKELAKKFLEGEVDKRTLASVSALKNKWEGKAW